MSSPSSLSSSPPPYKVFVWDTGTTGKDPLHDAIRSLAIVEYWSVEKVVTRFSTAVGPRDVKAVQHYDPRAPSFAAVWREFECFVRELSNGREPLLVSHNASFDVSFLLAELNREGIQISSDWRFGCSLQLARTLNIESQSHSQSDLADYYGVVPDREHHAETDVLTLRDILLAMNAEYCILPMLYRDAQEMPFFDRVPDKDADGRQEARFFVTLTGRKYHAKGCRWLSRSCIPKLVPPPGLKPCSTCRPEQVPQRSRASSSVQREISREVSESTVNSATTEAGKYFITNTGEKYHVEGCKWLSRSRIPRDTPPEGYRPCLSCLPTAVPHKREEREYNDSYPLETNAASQVYYITKTGTKYHVDGCKLLSRSMIPRDTPPVGYGPCRICLPNGVPRAISALSSVQSNPGPDSPVLHRASYREISSPEREERKLFYITNSGVKYHVDGCKWLSRSRIPREKPPPGYGPCRVCLPNGNPISNARALEDRIRSVEPAPEQPRLDVLCRTEKSSKVTEHAQSGSTRTKSYTTRTGRKFHIGTCKHLGKSKIEEDSVPSGYEACAVCLPYGVDRAKLGSGDEDSNNESLSKVASFPKEEANVDRTPLRSKKSSSHDNAHDEKDSRGSPRSAIDFAATF